MKLARGGDGEGGMVFERDKPRAELCSVFMAVVRILFGSEKGIGEALYSPPRGTCWHLLRGDRDCLLKGPGWRAGD